MASRLAFYEDLKKEVVREEHFLKRCREISEEKRKILSQNLEQEWNSSQLELLQQQIKSLQKDMESGRKSAKKLASFHKMSKAVTGLREEDISKKAVLAGSPKKQQKESWLLEMDEDLFRLFFRFFDAAQKLDKLYDAQLNEFPPDTMPMGDRVDRLVRVRISVSQEEKPLLDELETILPVLVKTLDKVIDELTVEEGKSKRIVKLRCDFHFHPNLHQTDDSVARAQALKWWQKIKEEKLDVLVTTEHMYKNPERTYDILMESRPPDPELVNVILFPGMEFMTKEGAEIIIFCDEAGFNYEDAKKEIMHNAMRAAQDRFRERSKSKSPEEVERLVGEEKRIMVDEMQKSLQYVGKFLKKTRNITLYMETNPLYDRARMSEIGALSAREAIDIARSRGYAVYLPHPYCPGTGGVDALGRQRILNIKRFKDITDDEVVALGLDEFDMLIEKGKLDSAAGRSAKDLKILLDKLGKRNLREVLMFYLVYRDEKYRLRRDEATKEFVEEHSSMLGMTVEGFSGFLKSVFDIIHPLGERRLGAILKEKKAQSRDIEVIGQLALVKLVRYNRIGLDAYNDAFGFVNRVMHAFGKKENMKLVETPVSLLDDAQPSFYGSGSDAHITESLGAHLVVLSVVAKEGDWPTRDEVYRTILSNKTRNFVRPKRSFWGEMWSSIRTASITIREVFQEGDIAKKRKAGIDKIVGEVSSELKAQVPDAAKLKKLVESLPDREALLFAYKKFEPEQRERFKMFIQQNLGQFSGAVKEVDIKDMVA
ncbi:hypothetical protein KY359_00990 [Candidatus Woesearchaeota archaeon]|nr:hypothetical protein [Candidatus Woesearchaeota archaeon]